MKRKRSSYLLGGRGSRGRFLCGWRGLEEVPVLQERLLEAGGHAGRGGGRGRDQVRVQVDQLHPRPSRQARYQCNSELIFNIWWTKSVTDLHNTGVNMWRTFVKFILAVFRIRFIWIRIRIRKESGSVSSKNWSGSDLKKFFRLPKKLFTTL